MGRKKTIEGGTVYHFRIDDELVKEIRDVMSELGSKSLSDYIRRALAQQITKDKARLELEAEITKTERERAIAAARKKVNEQIRKDAGYQPYTPTPAPDPELDAERAALEREAQAHDAKTLKAAEDGP